MKKTLIIFSLVVTVAIIGIAGFLYSSVPSDHIEKLSTHFIDVKYEKKEVSYKLVEKKPANWVTIKSIKKHAYQAIVISEDWAFFQHEGVDLSQIKESINDTIEQGKRLRGASTISQQVVKNLYFSNEYSFLRKIKEALSTIYLEKKVEKMKILEIYLNIIEFGDGIYGIKEASWHYFKKSPAKLNAREGAFLAMLLPNPKRYAQSFKDRELTKYGNEVVTSILNKMKVAKMLSKEQLEKELSRKFKWEKGYERLFDRKKVNKRAGKKRRAKRMNHKNEEEFYRNDPELDIEQNPTFDDDAIVEDISGIEEEFNLE